MASQELIYDLIVEAKSLLTQVKSALDKASKEGVKSGEKLGDNLAKGIKNSIDKAKIDILQGVKVDKFRLNQIKSEIEAGLKSGSLSSGEALGLFNALLGVANTSGKEVAKKFSDAFKITLKDRIDKGVQNLTQPFKDFGTNLSKTFKENFNKGLDKIGETSFKDLKLGTKNLASEMVENFKKIPSQIGNSLIWFKKNVLDFDLNKIIYKDFPNFTKQVFTNFRNSATNAFQSLKQLPSFLNNLDLNKVFSGLGGFKSAVQGGIKNLTNFGSVLSGVTSQGISGFGKMASTIAGGLSNALASAGKGVLDLGKNLAGGVATAGVAGAVAGGAGLFGLGVFGLNLASQIQSTRISLETMLGSAENAKGLMTEITAFAKKTPFNRLELFDYSKQLIGAGIAQKDMIKTLNKLGNVAAGSGAPLQNLITNYSQIRAGNRAYTQDLKQFSNFGIPIFEKLAKNMGITVEQLRNGIDAQEIKVNFQQVDKVLKDLTSSGGQYFDLMQKKSGTFEGAMSNIQDTAESMVLKFMGINDTGEVMEGGFFDMAQEKALRFQGWLMENEATIGAWGGKVFTKIGEGMQLAWTNMVQPILLDLKDWFDNGGKEAIKKFMQEGWKQIVDGFIYFKDVVYPDAKKKFEEFQAWLAKPETQAQLEKYGRLFWSIAGAIEALVNWTIKASSKVSEFVNSSAFQALIKAEGRKADIGSLVFGSVGKLFGGGRANGGTVEPGKLYEVGENNKAEMFVANGRQYMIPGNRGQVLNQQQIKNQTDNRQINSGNTTQINNFGNTYSSMLPFSPIPV